METRDAIALIARAVGNEKGIWADLGAGGGTFTRALAQTLAPGSTIYAVDRDGAAMTAIREWEARERANVVAVRADFTKPFELPGLGNSLLDGILLANALHFVADADDVLANLVYRVRVSGRVVVVEYDQRSKSRWVPYPIPATRWEELAAKAGLSKPSVTTTQQSLYSGVLYAAVAQRVR